MEDCFTPNGLEQFKKDGNQEDKNLLGKFCDAVNIKEENGELQIPENVLNERITNGLVCELKNYAESRGKTKQQLNEWILKLFGNNEKLLNSSITTKLIRVDNKRRKERGQKRIQFLNEAFVLPKPSCFLSAITLDGNSNIIGTSKTFVDDGPLKINQSINQSTSEPLNINQSINQSTNDPFNLSEDVAIETSIHTSQKVPSNSSANEQAKQINLEKYNTEKKEKFLKLCDRRIQEKKNELKSLENYFKHNRLSAIKKREKTAKETIKLLRFQLKKQRNHYVKELKKKDNTVAKEIANLKEEILKLALERDLEKKKKVTAQKLKSKYKKKLLKSNLTLQEENKLFHPLESSDSELSNDEKENVALRHHDRNKTFKDNVRLCALELLGQEVAAEKICSVIQTVSNRIFGKVIDSKELPNRFSVQNISDEGQFLVKKMYGDKICDSATFGINKDGTSRKKVKILETSITLDSGEVIPLGFRRKAHETARDIADNTKKELHELGLISGDDSFLLNALEKLGYFMNDRASNEKAANVLLNEWRTEVLKECKSPAQKEAVFSLHCMAHVLLGFARYTKQELSILQKEIEKDCKLGRASEGRFARFNHKDAATRVIRIASDLLGPIGDWKNGIRDVWEAACSSMHVKSLISCYKDNRFNGLFQCAAELVHHLPLLKEVLTKLAESKTRDNGKVMSELIDIKDPRLITLIQALAIVYIQITSPYWDLVNSNVHYLELYKYIKPLRENLQRAEIDPELFLDKNFSFIPSFKTNQQSALFQTTFRLHHQDCYDLLLKALSCIAKGFLTTINNQLSDFIEGQFSSAPSERDLNRTKNSHLHNLPSEHHFGDLDASQKRRPNASLHYHSSIHLIKRNHNALSHWLGKKTVTEQENLWAQARKFGKTLRKEHRREELKEKQTQIKEYQSLEKKGKLVKARSIVKQATKIARKKVKSRPGRKDKTCHNPSEIEFNLPLQDGPFKAGEWVAVAYNNGWWPGYLEHDSSDALPNTAVTVRFFHPASRPNTYLDNSKDDVRSVELRFIFSRIKSEDAPFPISGRFFRFDAENQLKTKYAEYCRKYF